MKLKSMKDPYVSELKDLYSAETQLLKALPKMAKAASSQNLREAIEEHLHETQEQKERIEQIARELDITPRGKKCKVMEDLIREGEEAISSEADAAVHDAALIAAAQWIEHYEMAGYGTLRAFAKRLGLERASELHQQTLDEEYHTDQILSEIAESEINVEAAQQSS